MASIPQALISSFWRASLSDTQDMPTRHSFPSRCALLNLGAHTGLSMGIGRSAACRLIRMEICALLLPLTLTRLKVNAYHCREAAIERKVDFILAKLRGTKKLDLFEPARVIHGVSIEQSTRIMAKFITRGKFDHIGLSEVRVEHIREAHKVNA